MQEKNRKKRRWIAIAAAGLAVCLALCAGLYWSRAMTPGWHEKDGQKAYYVTEEGQKAEGYQIISGKPYYFDASGKPAEKGWVAPQDAEDPAVPGEYYSLGDGQLATGWKYMDGKVWYFFQNEDEASDQDAGNDEAAIHTGRLARSYVTSGNISIPDSGYIDGDEGLALAYGIDVLDRYGWDLESAYRYSSALRFLPGASRHYGFKIHKCALQGFEKGKGNCLVWAGTFCTMARLLGKDCRQIWGTLQWKGTRPHSWTEIWEEDGIHVYDPRKNDGKGLAGFDKRYGQKGTYKYDEDSKKYLDW